MATYTPRALVQAFELPATVRVCGRLAPPLLLLLLACFLLLLLLSRPATRSAQAFRLTVIPHFSKLTSCPTPSPLRWSKGSSDRRTRLRSPRARRCRLHTACLAAAAPSAASLCLALHPKPKPPLQWPQKLTSPPQQNHLLCAQGARGRRAWFGSASPLAPLPPLPPLPPPSTVSLNPLLPLQPDRFKRKVVIPVSLKGHFCLLDPNPSDKHQLPTGELSERPNPIYDQVTSLETLIKEYPLPISVRLMDVGESRCQQQLGSFLPLANPPSPFPPPPPGHCGRNRPGAAQLGLCGDAAASGGAGVDAGQLRGGRRALWRGHVHSADSGRGVFAGGCRQGPPADPGEHLRGQPLLRVHHQPDGHARRWHGPRADAAPPQQQLQPQQPRRRPGRGCGQCLTWPRVRCHRRSRAPPATGRGPAPRCAPRRQALAQPRRDCPLPPHSSTRRCRSCRSRLCRFALQSLGRRHCRSSPEHEPLPVHSQVPRAAGLSCNGWKVCVCVFFVNILPPLSQIDGSLFVLLDDEMLTEDLGVSSKLHRMRLKECVKKAST